MAPARESGAAWLPVACAEWGNGWRSDDNMDLVGTDMLDKGICIVAETHKYCNTASARCIEVAKNDNRFFGVLSCCSTSACAFEKMTGPESAVSTQNRVTTGKCWKGGGTNGSCMHLFLRSALDTLLLEPTYINTIFVTPSSFHCAFVAFVNSSCLMLS